VGRRGRCARLFVRPGGRTALRGGQSQASKDHVTRGVRLTTRNGTGHLCLKKGKFTTCAGEGVQTAKVGTTVKKGNWSGKEHLPPKKSKKPFLSRRRWVKRKTGGKRKKRDHLKKTNLGKAPNAFCSEGVVEGYVLNPLFVEQQYRDKRERRINQSSI